MMKKLRIVLWVLVALALAGAVSLALRPPAEAPPSTSRADPSALVRFGGPFTLVDSDGDAFSSQQLAGRPHAVFFGFTNCPDVCPNTLSTLVRLRDQLGGEEAFEIVFVTVDPERDDPEAVGRYAEIFDSDIIGLTGSKGQIDAVKRQFGITSIRRGEDPDAYQVDHTANVFLVDEDGGFVVTLSPEESQDMWRQKLERIAA